MFIELTETESEIEKVKKIERKNYSFFLEEKIIAYTPNKHYEIKIKRDFTSPPVREIGRINANMQEAMLFIMNKIFSESHDEYIEKKEKQMELIKSGDNLLTSIGFIIEIKNLTNQSSDVTEIIETSSESYLFIKAFNGILKADKLSENLAMEKIKKTIINTISKMENLNPVFCF